ncbi:hypothetical protein [Streptomyces peucetius]|uniref:Uncharacterized protein n=1 Tax=Streptomyces peucetius TaxID=1950 RepID=A0ABY6I5N3_STRPE|nr:hypothetical protein [Streptomyces peucetius]UYQ62308.1 hypothetical protein OGH68_13015 [Streptomyces peucetius]
MRELNADFLNQQVAATAASQGDVPHGHGTTVEDSLDEGPPSAREPNHGAVTSAR